MEYLKGNASNVKVQCSCGRKFWSGVQQIVKCPDCKSIWDGTLVKYVVLRLQATRGGDYMTVFAGKHSSMALCLSELMTTATAAFYCSTGVQITEVTKCEFDIIDQEKVARDCAYFLAQLKAS